MNKWKRAVMTEVVVEKNKRKADGKPFVMIKGNLDSDKITLFFAVDSYYLDKAYDCISSDKRLELDLMVDGKRTQHRNYAMPKEQIDDEWVNEDDIDGVDHIDDSIDELERAIIAADERDRQIKERARQIDKDLNSGKPDTTGVNLEPFQDELDESDRNIRAYWKD